MSRTIGFKLNRSSVGFTTQRETRAYSEWLETKKRQDAAKRAARERERMDFALTLPTKWIDEGD